MAMMGGLFSKSLDSFVASSISKTLVFNPISSSTLVSSTTAVILNSLAISIIVLLSISELMFTRKPLIEILS